MSKTIRKRLRGTERGVEARVQQLLDDGFILEGRRKHAVKANNEIRIMLEANLYKKVDNHIL